MPYGPRVPAFLFYGDTLRHPAMPEMQLTLRVLDVSIEACHLDRWQAFLPFPMALRAEAALADDAGAAADQAEEDEDHHLAEPEVAVGLGPARVVPSGHHAHQAHRHQPRLVDHRHAARLPPAAR